MKIASKTLSRVCLGMLIASGVSIGLTSSVLAEQPANTLTRAESVAGWKLLFDGQSTQGWRDYKKEEVSEG